MNIKTLILTSLFIINLTIFCWLLKVEAIDYYSENGLSGSIQNQNTIEFKYGWNSFWWLLFINSIKTLPIPEIIRLWNTSKMCYKKITWIYYNNQRWMRFRPLDIESLNTLKTNFWTYDDLQIDWGFFTNCSGIPNNIIIWNITHQLWNYSYDLIAWIELNFWRNSYNSFWWFANPSLPWQELHLIQNTNWIFVSGYIFDSYGWIGVVSWDWNCIREVDPNKICTGETFIQHNNCGEVKIEVWKKICDDEHESPWAFCKYDDEDYMGRWLFGDTKEHWWFNYIEVMRKSCLHRGKMTHLWLWTYYPEDYIKKSEILKTLIKIRWIAFDNFEIESEDKIYPYKWIFEDVENDNWFSRYADYAFRFWLTDWLYETKNNKKYLNPDQYLNRYQTIKKLIETYNAINWWTINIKDDIKIVDVKKTNPYYNYIAQAESLWIIEGYKQKDWTYKFEWDEYITRAEFAKIVSTPFLLLLIWYE